MSVTPAFMASSICIFDAYFTAATSVTSEGIFFYKFFYIVFDHMLSLYAEILVFVSFRMSISGPEYLYNI